MIMIVNTMQNRLIKIATKSGVSHISDLILRDRRHVIVDLGVQISTILDFGI